MKTTTETEYLYSLWNNDVLNSVVSALCKKIKKLNPDFLACRGISGIIPTCCVSRKLDIPYVIVRKDRSHCDSRLEGKIRGRKYVIIDDFIQRGNTIRQIVKHIEAYGEDIGTKFQLQTVLLYEKITLDQTIKINNKEIKVMGIRP